MRKIPISKENVQLTLGESILPLIFFLGLLIYGLFLHSLITGESGLPLEVLILIAISFSSIYYMYKGFSWDTIQGHITSKVGESVPVIMILFCIGVLIGSWIISGTIPMLIYYGISVINGQWIYLFAFLICIVFSLLTGTSWGSAGTIGVVMMGIAQVYEADLAITAAAVVGGSFFGDKMSPLSDTTNIASLATDVFVFDHIKSMVYTTGPAAILAIIGYVILCFTHGVETDGSDKLESIAITLDAIDSIFNFNILLLLPLGVVLWGSISKKPIVLTLLVSSWVAILLALVFQDFSFRDVMVACKSGFSADMTFVELPPGADVINILNRGGLYNLIEGIVISLLIFAFIGSLDTAQAIQKAIDASLSKIQKKTSLMVSALTATLFTNLTTSNQYATSFIIGAAFKEKFDQMNIKRKVLSRSIEDAGTMMENLMPWTPSGIFMANTLGIAALDYAGWQILSLCNIVIAYFFAFTGIACFLNEKSNDDDHNKKETSYAE